ncbi:MAG: hypothetical protein RR721_08820 [Aeromonas sp.]|uniref:hypothetical protein n=1 Tax=Aeromonas sp. TaxID=647 RepID=UPI002FCC7D9C
MLSSRLPTELIARLLLALVLICNLTLCISWHSAAIDEGAPQSSDAMMLMNGNADTSPAMQSLACHDGQASAQSQDDCQMHGGLTGGIPLLAVLLTLFALPLLLMPRLGIGLLDQWLRNPLLRLRGAHPPSWPRRHLMLSVLRH